jgi:hypothetical protein
MASLTPGAVNGRICSIGADWPYRRWSDPQRGNAVRVVDGLQATDVESSPDRVDLYRNRDTSVVLAYTGLQRSVFSRTVTEWAGTRYGSVTMPN